MKIQSLACVRVSAMPFKIFLQGLYRRDHRCFKFFETYINVTFGWLKDYDIISRDTYVDIAEPYAEERSVCGFKAKMILSVKKFRKFKKKSEVNIVYGLYEDEQLYERIGKLVVKMILFIQLDECVVELAENHNKSNNLIKWLDKYGVTNDQYNLLVNLILSSYI